MKSTTKLPKGKICKVLLWIVSGIAAVFIYQIWLDAILYRIGYSDIELALQSCTVYRENDVRFPTLRLDIVARSEFQSDRTVTLRTISFPKYDMKLSFDPSTFFSIESNGSISDFKTLESEALDYFLRIPPSEDNFELVLSYSIQGVKGDVECRFTDQDLCKATYWVTPVFDSVGEAIGLPQVVLCSDLEAAEKARERSEGVFRPLNFFTSVVDKQCVWLSGLGVEQMLDSSGLDVDSWGTFKKKYGGFYFGLLREDEHRLQYNLQPYKTLSALSDYDERDLFGLRIPDGLSSLKEFIYFALDPSEVHASLAPRQKNSEYCVHLMHGTKYGIDQVCTSLSSKGFLTDNREASFAEFMQQFLEMSSSDKWETLIHTLNDHLWGTMSEVGTYEAESVYDTVRCSIPNAVFENGVLVFCPDKQDGQVMVRITESLTSVYGDRPICVVSFDCSPLNRLSDIAPFAKPVLVFLNYPPDAPCAMMGPFGITSENRIAFGYDIVDCSFYRRWNPMEHPATQP